MLYYLVSNQIDGYMHICNNGSIYFSNKVNKEEIKSFENLSDLLKYLANNRFFNLAPLLIEEQKIEKKKKTIKKTTKKPKK